MSIAYIIAAHKNPTQVARLVHRLATDHATFVVHVDRRAPSHVDDGIRRELEGTPNVHFVKRNRVYWAGIGVVTATVKAFDYLLDQDLPFDHAVLLSGQTYPLLAPEAIEAFFANAAGQSFMQCVRFPHRGWQEGGLPRIEQWHLILRWRRSYNLPWKRRIPGGLAPHGGETWGAFSRPLVEYLREFVRRNPRYVRFFRHVKHANEIFWQTIMMNSPLAETVVSDHLHYIDWKADPGPVIFRASDLERLLQSGKLFARKFDTSVDAEILDLLDAHIERGRMSSPAGHLR